MIENNFLHHFNIATIQEALLMDRFCNRNKNVYI